MADPDEKHREAARQGFYQAWLNHYPRVRDEPELRRRCAAVVYALFDLKDPVPADRVATAQELADADYILTAAKAQVDFVRSFIQMEAEMALEAEFGAPRGEA